MAEAEDLKSSKCGFDPHSGHESLEMYVPVLSPTRSSHYDCEVHFRALNGRVLLNSGVLLLGAVIAHAIACGTFIPLLPFVGISLALIAILSLLSVNELKGLPLICVVATAQFSGHLLLGSSQMKMWAPVCGGTAMSYTRVNIASSMSSTPMIVAHMCAGAASYVFIRKSESFWNFAGYFLFSIISPVYRPVSTTRAISLAQARMVLTTFIKDLWGFLTEATTRLSAPPAFALNI